jgi:hypothetical protein
MCGVERRGTVEREERTTARRRIGGVVLSEKLEGAQHTLSVHLQQNLPSLVVLVCTPPRPAKVEITTTHTGTHNSARVDSVCTARSEQGLAASGRDGGAVG